MNITNIVKKMMNYTTLYYDQIKYEDSDGYYKVWKVEIDNNLYILKQVENDEFNFYNTINSNYIPKIYGSCSYYNKKYILIEYIYGKNLMQCERQYLEKALAAIIGIQKQYLNYDNELINHTNKSLQSVINRKQYLNDKTLENTYEMFIDRYQKTKKTLVHKDLLPFNILSNDDKAVLIDWEHYGILPYPLMLCRLLAHCKEDRNYLFYMKKEDQKFAITYYYTYFVSLLGIDFDTYLEDINYFMFYEYTEWIYVYNKYNNHKDERYEYYLEKANEYVYKISNRK